VLMAGEVPGIGRRLSGLVIDFIMLELAMWPLGLAIRELTPSAAVLRLLQFVIAVFYSSVFLAERGQTPGKIMASLRVLSTDGGPLNQRQAVVRSVIKWACVFGPLVLMALAIGPLPTNVQQIGTEVPLIEPEMDPLMGVYGFVIAGLWLALLVITRRHRDHQAPHDRVAGAMVIKVQ